MASLRYPSTYPPGGWMYIQQDTRLKVTGENHSDLMKRVLEHRVYKGLPRATLAEVTVDVERQICSRLSARDCVPEGPDDVLRPPDENMILNAGTVLAFSKAAFDWLRTGAKVVDLDLMKKRQDTCLACPLNQPLKSCACSPFYKIVNALVPANRRNDQLFVCVACGCSIPAKTQMPIEMVVQADGGRNIQYAPECWVLAEKAEVKT